MMKEQTNGLGRKYKEKKGIRQSYKKEKAKRLTAGA